MIFKAEFMTLLELSGILYSSYGRLLNKIYDKKNLFT